MINQPPEPSKLGGIIWAIAIVVILMIVGFTFFKFRPQIMEIINRLLKRKPKAPPAPPEEYPAEEGEAPPEEAPPEEEESRYRTEWY